VYGWFSALVSVFPVCFIETVSHVQQVAIATLFQWASIYIAHIRFRSGLRAQGIDRRTLPFKGFLSPYAQYLALVIVLFVFGCEFYLACFPFGEKGSAKSFFTSCLAAPLFAFDYLAYKVIVHPGGWSLTYYNAHTPNLSLDLLPNEDRQTSRDGLHASLCI
jgi:amino acid permease